MKGTRLMRANILRERAVASERIPRPRRLYLDHRRSETGKQLSAIPARNALGQINNLDADQRSGRWSVWQSYPLNRGSVQTICTDAIKVRLG